MKKLNPNMSDGKIAKAPSVPATPQSSHSGHQGPWSKQTMNNTKQVKVHSKSGK